MSKENSRENNSRMRESVSLILPNYNNAPVLDLFFQKLVENTHYGNYEFIVVDDGSSDSSVEVLKKWRSDGCIPNFTLVEKPHSGVVETLNVALEKTRGKLICRLDGDATIETPNWLTKMVQFYTSHADIGMVVAKIFFDNGRLHSAGRNVICLEGLHDRGTTITEEVGNRTFDGNVKRGKDTNQFDQTCEVDTALGCCTLFSRELAQAIGGFDTGYAPVWLEDDDFGLNVRRLQKKVYYFPEVCAVHRISQRNRRHDGSWFKYFPQRVIYKLSNMILNPANRESNPWRMQILRHHYAYWLRKWGFDPLNPDLDFIFHRYQGTEICWRFEEDRKQRGEQIVRAYV